MSSALPEAPVAGDDVAVFHRTLAELCRAEVPLPRALDVLGREARGPLRGAVEEMRGEVEAGAPLHEAYARHRFPPVYAALVEAGTEAGDLPSVLREIADHAARAAETTRRIRRALAGPLVTAAFVLTLGVGAVLTVAPTTWQYTQTVGDASPLPIALGALGLVFAFVLGAFVVTAHGRRGPGEGRLRLPVVSRLRREASRAVFSSTLALLLRRGIPLPRALELTASTLAPRRMRERVEAMAERAREGAGLAASLGDDVLEPSLLWLVEASDGSRDAATALEDIAALHRQRLERGLDGALVLVRPLAELTIGVAVFALAYCFLIPLFAYAQRLFG